MSNVILQDCKCQNITEWSKLTRNATSVETLTETLMVTPL